MIAGWPVPSPTRRSAASSRAIELARAERLGDVVVRAGVERADLGRLVPDGGQHEHRHLRPLAQPAQDVDPVTVRQHEVDDRRVGRAHRGGVERLLDGLRRDRLEAGLAQHDLQRAQDLRLVVADEDPPALRHAAASSGPLSASSTTTVVPWPGTDSSAIRPPFASTKPLAIARPSPEPV